jgi:hypothetical protein
VKLLLANKADVTVKNSKGTTPLHFAAQEGYKEVAELLLASKADVNAKNNDGYTPLHFAAAQGRKEMAALLLANRADVDAKTNDHKTPLHAAAVYGHKDVAELLLAIKADVNVKSDIGATPLHMAAANGHKDVAELLMANKADVNAKIKDGRTALEIAVAQGHEDMAELLRSHSTVATTLPATRPVQQALHIDGAVCGIDKANHTIKVIPWDKEKKLWDTKGIRIFKLMPETVIVGETTTTVADIDGGKGTVKSFHFTGFGPNGPTGTPFEIKEISQILHRRVTVSWSGDAEMPQATKVGLPYLFAGESMPAMVGNSGAQAVGGDDVTVGSGDR